MADQQPRAARLEDVLNYKPEDYLSPDELSLIRSTFRDKRVIRVLRKVFLPTMADPDLPLEELKSDMWFIGFNWESVSNEQAKSLIVARQDAIKFIMGSLVKLKVLAATKEESDIEASVRQEKDSAK